MNNNKPSNSTNNDNTNRNTNNPIDSNSKDLLSSICLNNMDPNMDHKEEHNRDQIEVQSMFYLELKILCFIVISKVSKGGRIIDLISLVLYYLDLRKFYFYF